MITHKLNSERAFGVNTAGEKELNLLQKFNAFADSQKSNQTLWWLLSLMVIGGLALPLTFLLVYTLDGPVVPFLVLSMLSFFACIVSNMGGSGIRLNIGIFFFSAFLHIAMIAFMVAF